MVVLPSSAKETVDKDDEDCGADEDVELVSLAGEADDAEDDAEDGSGDEKEDSELDDAGGGEVGCAMKDLREAGDGRGAKVDVAGDGGGGVSQGEDAAEEDDCRGDGYSPAEHVGDGGVELFVGEGFHFRFFR